MAGRVLLEQPEPRIARLMLRGDSSLNLFDLAMRDALIETVHAVAELPDVRVVVLGAEGRHFSAGADLTEFGTAEGIVERRRIRWARDPWVPLWELPQPVIAALHGVAMGAGLEMALLCDVRLAAPDTILSLPEPRLGMLPSAGGTQSAARGAGLAEALRLCLAADRLDADAALARGLVHIVEEDVDEAALALARRIARVPGPALRSAKRLARTALESGLQDGLRLERLHAALTRAASPLAGEVDSEARVTSGRPRRTRIR